MTSKPAFKTVFTIILTAIFGYLMYMLLDSVKTGLFFIEETNAQVALMAAAIMAGPIVLSIICSIIRKRYLWLLSVANLFLWAIIGSGMGEETTMGHAFAYGGMIVVPYILCLIMILGKKKGEKVESNYVPRTGSSYSGSSSGYSGSSGGYSSSKGSMSFTEKEDYILHNCHSAYYPGAMDKIDNDPNLTDSQKEELKNHLFIYGD